MPRIDQAILDTTFYLYPTVEDAKAGTSLGGTGFLVAYLPLGMHRRDPHVYAVTNWHVAVRGGSPIVRLNTLDGNTDTFPFDVSEWKFIPLGDDVAAVRLPVDPSKHQIHTIPLHMFAPRIWHYGMGNIGTGEDVFMVGRFMDHDGGTTNQPAVRFGNISVMPTPIYIDELDRKRDYYCIDLHSRTGSSGSPVFIYRTLGQDLSGADMKELVRKIQEEKTLYTSDTKPSLALLGIHCGQFPERWEYGSTKNSKNKKKNNYVIGMSGMTLVSPSVAIFETLEHPDLKKEREELDAAKQQKGSDDGTARFESGVKAKTPRTPTVDDPRWPTPKR